MSAVQKTTLIGIAAAMEIAVVYLFGLLPGIGLVGAMAAGILLIFLRDTAGALSSYLCYAISAVLLLLLLSKKLPAAAYTALFGYYPVLFADMAKIKSVPLRGLLKLLCFEGVLAIALLIAKFVIGFDSMHIMQAAADRGFTVKTAVIVVVVLYQFFIAVYEAFLWIYYTRFNESVTARLRSVIRRR